MQPWFEQAKLGIFLHWGIYAVNGIPESWSFYRGRISYEDYMKQAAGFTASAYDPKEWAKVFKQAGAQYAVLTAKHHDGFALWDTQVSDLSVVKMTPAGRDLIGPYCDALREEGLKVGIYFSHLDWSHPDYPSVFPDHRGVDEEAPGYAFSYPPKGQEAPQRWEKFLTFHRAQLKELCEQYRPDLLWFDGDWERSADQWRMAELRDQLHAWSPGVVLNSRIGGHGDYLTPEQGIPIQRPDGIWEFCVTVNNSWGYQKGDDNHKSVRQIVRMFCEVIGMGGRLLLDVGPYEDGTLQPEQIKRLEGLGAWIAKHQEAVTGTQAGLPHGHFYGASCCNADKTVVYLYLFDRPWEQVAVKGIRNEIKSVTVLGTGRELAHRKVGGAKWINLPGVLWIDTPESELDENATVIRVELEGALDLYTGAGQAVEVN